VEVRPLRPPLRPITTPPRADYSHVALDNLQFSVSNTVPETATLPLLTIGLLALATRQRR